MSKLSEEGAIAINVLCDDTDVFVLLLNFYHKLDLTCGLTMESTHSERALVDIAASAKEHAKIAPQLPAIYYPSGCGTVVQLFGVGTTTADMSDTRVQVWSRKMGRKNMTAAPKNKDCRQKAKYS